MRHSFLDRYQQGTSLAHRLDPRLKLLATLAFVLAVTTTPPGTWIAFALLAALAIGAVLTAQVPLVEGLKRSAIALPFAGMVAISLPFTQAGEAVLGDRRVDHPLFGELLQETLADFIGAVILGHFLAHQENR